MQAEIEDKITGLGLWERPRLVAEFTNLWNQKPPKGLSSNILRKSVEYQWRIQEAGNKTLLRELDKLVRSAASQINGHGKAATSSTLRIKPGTRLRRTWKGKIVEVIAEERGFRFGDKLCGSLSEAAREITGTRWNGHIFFGLKEKERTRVAK